MKYDDIHKVVNKMSSFNEREVGITHPDNNSFVKINDNGDIEAFAGEGLGIIIRAKNRSITLMADTVRFMVRDMGVSINDTTINEKARKFTEPSLIPYDFDRHPTMYEYTESYINDDYDYVGPDKIIDPNTKMTITREEYKEKYGKYPEWNGISYV